VAVASENRSIFQPLPADSAEDGQAFQCAECEWKMSAESRPASGEADGAPASDSWPPTAPTNRKFQGVPMHIAKVGDRVRVQCTHVPASPRATARPAKVFEFIVGSPDIMRGLSLGVVGMTQGDHKRLKLQPKDAYGSVRDRLIREVPRGSFPPRLSLRVGKRLTAKLRSTGRRQVVRIVRINPDSVIVDGNHRLAGKAVTLDVQLLSVNASVDSDHSSPQSDENGDV
jgi:FKBP-type peptidyl-prolyl cis-trans isomerase 2